MGPLRAAKNAVLSVKKRLNLARSSFNAAESSVGSLAEALKAHSGDDRYYAILCLAMEHSKDADSAVLLADRAYAVMGK